MKFPKDQKIFLGMGRDSEKWVQHLHQQLDEALTLLSGLQQGGQDERAEDFIDEVADQLYAALTGKKVVASVRPSDLSPCHPDKDRQTSST